MAQAVEKISKACVLRFTAQKLHFIVKNVSGGTQVYSHIDHTAILEEYRVESLHRNEIWLEVPSDFIAKAFKSAIPARDISLKLAKKNGQGLLTLCMKTESRSGREMEVQQDVPVLVLKATQIAELKEPKIPAPDVYILLPPLSVLRTLAERMRSIGQYVTVAANFSGSLMLKCETEAVCIETMFTDLLHPHTEQSQEDVQNRDVEEFKETRVDVRDFIKFVHSYHVNPSNVVCCIHHGVCLVFYVYVGNVNEAEGEEMAVLTYYLPGKLN